MTTRVATCRCGQLKAVCSGEPVRISVCHCLDCKKRSGSAFSFQARWPNDAIDITGDTKSWNHTTDSGSLTIFRFCPVCGSTLYYTSEGMPGVTAIPVGAFADPAFPAPDFSVYENRKHDWIAILGDQIEHD